jgi:hypothetical protein
MGGTLIAESLSRTFHLGGRPELSDIRQSEAVERNQQPAREGLIRGMRNPTTLLIALVLIIAACGGANADEQETDGSPPLENTSTNDPGSAAVILPPQLAAVAGA